MPINRMKDPGVVKIRNVSGSPYTIEELNGHVLAHNASVNLCDPEVPNYYQDWEAANRLVSELTTAKLYQDIQAGKLTVVLSRPPLF